MIYLLRYDSPIGTTGIGSAQHYLGYCSESRVKSRLREHATGTWMELSLGRTPPRIPQVFFELGIKFKVVFLDEGDRKEEKRLKKYYFQDLYMLDPDGENGRTREFNYLREL